MALCLSHTSTLLVKWMPSEVSIARPREPERRHCKNYTGNGFRHIFSSHGRALQPLYTVLPFCSDTCTPRRRRHTVCATIGKSIVTTDAHTDFIPKVAKMDVPPLLPSLLQMLEVKGDEILLPSDRSGILPLAIPLSRNPESGLVTALLRWPTPPEGMEMPVVAVAPQGVTLLAKTVTELVHRMLVEEDAAESKHAPALFAAAGEEGQKLYTRGDYSAAKLPSLDVYLMRKVGYFPDVLERLAMRHFDRGDEVSALVTGEFYVGAAQKSMPGFGRPFVFNAELFSKVGRPLEAKDAARMALKSPWWTLGASYQEVANIAGWNEEKIEYVRERITDEARQDDLNKGKTPEQVSLDQAAFLLDCAAADENWDDIRDQLAKFYEEAGFVDMARFVLSGRDR